MVSHSVPVLKMGCSNISELSIKASREVVGQFSVNKELCTGKMQRSKSRLSQNMLFRAVKFHTTYDRRSLVYDVKFIV